MRLVLTAAVTLIAVMGLSSCESKEKVALAKAEQCINRATQNTVSACMTHLEGYESEKAYMLRCSALYIQQGFTGDRLSDAFQRIKTNSSGGKDPMLGALGFMAFQNTTVASLAENYCMRSNVLSMERLVAMSVMATRLASMGGIVIPADGASEADIENAIATIQAEMLDGLGDGVPSTEDLAALSSTIVTASEGYCGVGSAYEKTPICTNLNASIASGTTPEAIVGELLNQLQQN